MSVGPNDWPLAILGNHPTRVILRLGRIAHDPRWRGALDVCTHPMANRLRALLSAATQAGASIRLEIPRGVVCPVQLREVATEVDELDASSEPPISPSTASSSVE